MRILLLLLLASTLQAEPLVLYHDMLTSLAHTKEPEARIGYTKDRVEIRTRRAVRIVRTKVFWIDVLLTARFEQRGKQVQLIAQSLRVAGMEQKGARFEEASAGLLKLVNVEMTADRVEILRAGKPVYTQVLE